MPEGTRREGHGGKGGKGGKGWKGTKRQGKGKGMDKGKGGV